MKVQHGTTDGSTEEIPPATGDGTDAGTDESADNTEDALNTDDLSEESQDQNLIRQNSSVRESMKVILGRFSP